MPEIQRSEEERIRRQEELRKQFILDYNEALAAKQGRFRGERRDLLGEFCSRYSFLHLVMPLRPSWEGAAPSILTQKKIEYIADNFGRVARCIIQDSETGEQQVVLVPSFWASPLEPTIRQSFRGNYKDIKGRGWDEVRLVSLEKPANLIDRGVDPDLGTQVWEMSEEGEIRVGVGVP